MGEGGTVRPCCMLTLMEAFLHYIAAAHMNSSALHRCSIGRQLERNFVGVIEAQRISTVWGFPFIAVIFKKLAHGRGPASAAWIGSLHLLFQRGTRETLVKISSATPMNRFSTEFC